MHFYRVCLILLHIGSLLCYLPYLMVHITYLSFDSISFQSKFAYITYWVNYCVVVIGVLIWCLFVVCRKQTPWQIIQVSGFLLIAKLIYTILDLITKILLRHELIVVIFDLVHIIILFPAILITFLLVQHVKRIIIVYNESQS
ncbi:unnamed protein product [Rotaria sp. Silwood2]|nr:unnamed protein product [Rotaria sp. Silwood2]CAF2631666.1 unnamed protein product [Rotaria sp. Silwood2]CAF2876264.1 unnamed protein product [Rotaria sp. Silwood2]CAF3045144.1 unnamed protein product [Rotaria sp. Silwood2]CAF3903319.1 unnamed protein product [Rotaria sp. Silwood2]